MAIVTLKSGTWYNSDGLLVQFPQATSVVTRAGEVKNFGRHCSEVVLALTTLPTQASGNIQIISETCVIPSGVFIEEVQVFVLKETAGVNANLDVGLIRLDRATELDYNGFLAAADDFNSGTDLGGTTAYTRGAGSVTTEGGALIGTKTANAGLLTANPETADWTAGILRIRVFWSVPLTAEI